MYSVEEQNSIRNRQKLLIWLEEALGTLSETLADFDDESSALAEFRSTICESVDGVLLSLVDAMESGDQATWELVRRLTDDRSEMMREIRTRFLNWDPPLPHLALINVFLVTNSVEETFFLFSKMAKDFDPISIPEEHVPQG